LPPVAPGQVSTRAVTVTDPGSVPIVLGSATVTGPDAAALALVTNGCAGVVLEPRETCSVSLRFAPQAPGDVTGDLELATDDGTLEVPLSAAAPSLSGLLSPDLPSPRFIPTRAGDGVGYPQRWQLQLTNPFSAPVSIGRATLSGADARRFRITSNHCAHATVRAHGGCRMAVMFTPTRPGTAQAQLILQGTGLPLIAQLRPVAFALPGVTRLTATATHVGCAVAVSGRGVVRAMITQHAIVHWMLAPARGSARPACRHVPAAGAPMLTGTVRTARHVRRGGYPVSLTLRPRTSPLPAGTYVLTVSATDEHGQGPERSFRVAVRR
jgi:hypothetical protein